MMIKRAITGIILLLLMFASGCVERRERAAHIDGSQYFPLNEGDRYVYSGVAGEIAVTRQIDSLFTRAYLDSAGKVITWEDFSRSSDGVFWNSVALAGVDLQVHFYPSLPFAPWSKIIGDTLLVPAVEIRSDSVNSHFRIQVECEIMAIEDVTTPAGTFPDCIKMRVKYTYLDEKVRRIFADEIVRWFARDVGIVRYQTGAVSGDLMQATVAGVNYPR